MAPKLPPCVDLNDGTKMPLIGLGTYKSKPGEVEQAVKDAIDAGYRHIDTALIYQNEAEVGAAIREKIDSGAVTRKELYVVTKLWNTHHNPLIVVPALKSQLKTLGLDYVDLYLIHWPLCYADTGSLLPFASDGKFILAEHDYVDTYKAMEECVRLGLTKSIGLSNFNSQQIQRVLDNCTIKPVTNQVESHPWVNQDKLLDFCKSKGIVLTGYAPLGSPDRPWAKPGDPALLDDPEIKAIADKHGKSPAQICLRFQVQRGIVSIPKSVTKKRIEENLNIFDFNMTDEEMDVLRSFDRGNDGRLFAELAGDAHKYYPFRGVEF